MIDISKAGTYPLGARRVQRLGYGAMQLAGKGVFGPPEDRAGAVAVMREAVDTASTTLTRATSTGRMSPTRSFAGCCSVSAT